MSRLIKVLRNDGWRVFRNGVGKQEIEDRNTCGYHVLQWIKQIGDMDGNLPDKWGPDFYDQRKWVNEVCETLDYDMGAGYIRGTEARKWNPVRIGSAEFRRGSIEGG